MIKHKFTFSTALIVLSQFAIAQTGQWKLTGNNLAGTEKLGSTNNAGLNFITGNKTRMSITGSGNLNITSDQTSIQFPVPGANPKPMMFMFPSGDLNTNRMVIAHSPMFPDYGLQYNDGAERFVFLSAGNSVLNVDLGTRSVNVTSSFNVLGNSTFTGNVNLNTGRFGIGTSTPKADLHIFKGSSGASPFFSAPLVIENSSTAYLNILAPNNAETGILFGNPSSNIDGGILYNSLDNTKGLEFRANGNKTNMTLRNNGFLGLGTISPSAELHVVHADIQDGNHGFKIQNAASGDRWTFLADAFGSLVLFQNNGAAGFFERDGEYSAIEFKGKTNAEKASDVLEKVMQLNVKMYHSSEDKTPEKMHYGMIAQEVQKIFPEIVSHKVNKDQDFYGVSYSAYGVIAIKAIQEQQKKIQDQEQTSQEQQQEIITLEDRIAKLEAALDNGRANSAGNNNIISKEISGITLEQNRPNPFNQTTTIRYRIPQNATGQINLFDVNGILVKTLKTNESGQTVITGNDLKAGTYTYTLVVNRRIAASKKLVLIK